MDQTVYDGDELTTDDEDEEEEEEEEEVDDYSRSYGPHAEYWRKRDGYR